MGSEMLFVNFNQDFTCLSVGSRHGYKIYNCEPFGKYFMKRMSLSPVVFCGVCVWRLMAADGAIAICEMLFQTSLVALVGIGDEHTMSPRKLQITNTKVYILKRG
jgi:autophagy-related protein 18